MQYREYARGFEEDPELRLYDASQSVKFENSEQLVRLGIMQAAHDEDGPEINPTQVDFPKIGAVPDGAERPFWSVMITVYDRTELPCRCVAERSSAGPRRGGDGDRGGQ